MTVCIDTNAYSALMKGNERLAAVLDRCERIFVPAAVIEELIFGFIKGTRYAENLLVLNEFMNQDRVSFVSADFKIAARCGLLMALLKTGGTPIPMNDVWIAATALELNAALLTYDSHFDVISGLETIAP